MRTAVTMRPPLSMIDRIQRRWSRFWRDDRTADVVAKILTSAMLVAKYYCMYHFFLAVDRWWGR